MWWHGLLMSEWQLHSSIEVLRTSIAINSLGIFTLQNYSNEHCNWHFNILYWTLNGVQSVFLLVIWYLVTSLWLAGPTLSPPTVFLSFWDMDICKKSLGQSRLVLTENVICGSFLEYWTLMDFFWTNIDTFTWINTQLH